MLQAVEQHLRESGVGTPVYIEIVKPDSGPHLMRLGFDRLSHAVSFNCDDNGRQWQLISWFRWHQPLSDIKTGPLLKQPRVIRAIAANHIDELLDAINLKLDEEA